MNNTNLISSADSAESDEKRRDERSAYRLYFMEELSIEIMKQYLLIALCKARWYHSCGRVRYRKTGYSMEFLEAYREEILLHKASKTEIWGFFVHLPESKSGKLWRVRNNKQNQKNSIWKWLSTTKVSTQSDRLAGSSGGLGANPQQALCDFRDRKALLATNEAVTFMDIHFLRFPKRILC